MLSASKSGQFGGYTISRSVRLRSSASAYFNRTFAGSPTTFTFSCWLKRGTLSATQVVAASGYSGGARAYISFNSDDTLYVQLSNGSGTASGAITTTAVFRDPSAWYHIVYRATSGGTGYLYVNNQQVGSAAISSGYWLFTSSATYVNALGRYADNASLYFDGYLTEVNFIDGQALTPSSFGQYNAYGVWSPLKYNGTYGTNGFYLNFSDNSGATSTTIGKDYSGNGNNWTPNNISVTAGTTYDSMTDVPTLNSPTAANYCVLNPLDNVGTTRTVSNGNLQVTGNSYNYGHATVAVSSGKWYWEITPTSGTATYGASIGVDFGYSTTSGGYPGNTATSYAYIETGSKFTNSSATAYGSSYTDNDVIGVALDLDAGTLVFYKNGVSQGTAFSGLSGTAFPFLGARSGSGTEVLVANFGQRPFSYTPPSGYKALNTFNLPTPTIGNGANYMNILLYTGDGTTSKSVTGLNFQPDMVYVKNRSAASDPVFSDAVRGITKVLYTDATSAESTAPVFGYINSVSSTGINVNSGGSTEANFNKNGQNYVAWNWLAGNATSSNTSGSITSTVSVNSTAGFSVVTYTGNGTAGATIGHGLGAAPVMIIVKNRSRAMNWWVYGSAVTSNNNYGLFLNTTDALQNQGGYGQNNTYPTSTVFYGGIGGSTSFSYSNYSGDTYVAYCWTPIAGYSAFGSYQGNGSSDGVFVYLGFRPRFVLFKRTDSAVDWQILDSSRNTYNLTNLGLYPDLNFAEQVETANVSDFLSNGFKVRGTGSASNASGGTYIYAAFAENPFKYSNAR